MINGYEDTSMEIPKERAKEVRPPILNELGGFDVKLSETTIVTLYKGYKHDRVCWMLEPTSEPLDYCESSSVADLISWLDAIESTLKNVDL